MPVLLALVSAGTAAAVPYVERVPNALSPQACGGAGCWTNHLRVADLDLDGDLDLVLANYADFFSGNNDPEPLVVYTNDGAGAFTNASAAAVGGYQGNLRQIAIGDVTGDGAPDLFAPSGAGGAPVLFINDGAGAFTNEVAARLPAGTPQGAAARMGDVDGDGDLDLFAADGYASAAPPFGRLYLNDGTGVFTDPKVALPTMVDGSDINDVELADVDRDFDLDIVLNAHEGGTGALWLNDGLGGFVASDTLAPMGAGSGFHYNVAPCDVDGDGDLDLWIDNTGGGYREQLQINDGTGTFTDETAARVSGQAAGADDNGVVCVDIDDDDDFDAVVLSLSTAERLLVNDGTGHFTGVDDAFPAGTDCTLWGEFGDLDGDGRLDLVTGQGECSSSDEVYLGTLDQPIDTRAPKILAVQAPAAAEVGSVAAAVYAVSDRTVTDGGPQLARAYAALDTGVEVDATFMGGDLFRVALPTLAEATLTYTLCAVDRQGNVGCSAEQVTAVTAAGGTTTPPTDTGTAPTEPTPTEPTTDTTDVGTIDTGTGGDAESCGCASGTAGAPWLALGLAALWVRRRR